jgi:CYTH domain-containing protein/CHAD domain-containing protein
MALEIERKFRLPQAPAWLAARGGEEIEQGYLSIDEDSEVRLRCRGEDRILTVKRGRGESRDELEVLLDRELFDRLWAVTEGRRLSKRRTVVALDDGLRAEVDVYSGRHDGLVVVEVEFGSEAERWAFEPPAWFGEEVSGDERYANRGLALAPRPPEIDSGADGNLGGVGDGEKSGPGTAYRLKEEVPASGLRRIAAGRLQKAGKRVRDAGRGEEVAESVHAARKDLKKLRAALRLVRDQLDEKDFRAQNRRFRAAGRTLAATRDAQVKAETLDSLLEHAQLDASARLTAEAWRRALAEEREAATARAEEDGEAVVRPALELLEAAGSPEEWPLDEGRSWSLVAAGLVGSYERGRRAMRQAEGGDAEAVHQWRKRAKDLRYQLHILRIVWPETMEAATMRAKELTDLLGDHHDLTVLAEDLAGRDLPRPEAIELEAALEARQRQLLGEALELGRRIYVEKPGAFRRRIHGYWKLWDPPRG